MAVLVEDAWQHRGLGAALTRMLIDEAVGCHIARLTATVLSDNTAVTRMLAATMGRPAEVQRYGPETRFTFGWPGDHFELPGKNTRPGRRKAPWRGDDRGVSGQAEAVGDPAREFLALYDRALPHVYGYLLARCGSRAAGRGPHRRHLPGGRGCRARWRSPPAGHPLVDRRRPPQAGRPLAP